MAGRGNDVDELICRVSVITDVMAGAIHPVDNFAFWKLRIALCPEFDYVTCLALDCSEGLRVRGFRNLESMKLIIDWNFISEHLSHICLLENYDDKNQKRNQQNDATTYAQQRPEVEWFFWLREEVNSQAVYRFYKLLTSYYRREYDVFPAL